MRETRTLEFKETITNTFLKTVSAFSNPTKMYIHFCTCVINPLITITWRKIYQIACKN